MASPASPSGFSRGQFRKNIKLNLKLKGGKVIMGILKHHPRDMYINRH